MFPFLVAIGALSVLVWDLMRPSPPPRPLWIQALRTLPFAIVSVLSIVTAGRAPNGRHPFQVDWSLAAEDLARSMTKVPHLQSIAVLFLLAVIALGVRRLGAAFAITMSIGVAWEIAEATVVGHHARLSDLAPDLVAALLAIGFVAGLRRVLTRRPADAEREKTS